MRTLYDNLKREARRASWHNEPAAWVPVMSGTPLANDDDYGLLEVGQIIFPRFSFVPKMA